MSVNFWEGEKIRLRGLEPADAPIFHEWNQDSEMARNMDFLWPPSSLAGVVAWIENTVKKEPLNNEYEMVMETKEGVFVGTINSHHCNQRVGCFSYGVAVRREHQRQGYAREAILLLLRYFFHELRYQKVTAQVFSFNEPSMRLHERLGFQLEGRLRQTLFSNGRHHDRLYYGLTRTEFEELYPLKP